MRALSAFIYNIEYENELGPQFHVFYFCLYDNSNDVRFLSYVKNYNFSKTHQQNLVHRDLRFIGKE